MPTISDIRHPSLVYDDEVTMAMRLLAVSDLNGGAGAASATVAQTSVSDSASSVTLLASNANRRGASIANDSSAALYLKLGATASTSSYTARIAQYGYYEVPFGYTGVIDGIWASDPNDGAARVTELS